MPEHSDTPYEGLSPDLILDSLEDFGLVTTGGLLPLNSYENRVYQVELDEQSSLDQFVVVKYYRPERWSDEEIFEEHEFTLELAELDLPVVAPLAFDGATLLTYQGFRFAVFPRQGGHPPNLENTEDFKVLARTLGRIHSVGAVKKFTHRARLSIDRLGHSSRDFLLSNNWLPLELEEAYASVSEHLLTSIEQLLPAEMPEQRIHGDCHMGNVLWRGDLPHFVDLDDCVMGPEVQDLWMLLSGERDEMEGQLRVLLDAYLPFHELGLQTLAYIEPLRTLRLMHHAAWLARRWDDPAFPSAFPWFDSEKYWSEHILELREQQSALQEPPLQYLI